MYRPGSGAEVQCVPTPCLAERVIHLPSFVPFYINFAGQSSLMKRKEFAKLITKPSLQTID